jgi:hypothetical protein
MTSYYSVHNTAKNGRLIRAEIREYVLGMALRYGFYKDKALARVIYPDNERRIGQCTFLNLPKKPELDPAVYGFGCPELIEMPAAVIKTIGSYFKSWTDTDEQELFYDTKKFRIYCQRLVYGPDKKITLKHTAQYIWTNYLAMLFCLYGGHTYGSGWCSIDIRDFAMYAHGVTPHDKYVAETGNRLSAGTDRAEEADDYIRKYLLNTVHADCHLVAGVIFFQTPAIYQTFWDIANKEAVRIYEKLKEGGYLGKDRNEENCISRKD